MAEERGMNQRIKNLRKISTETQPSVDLERARIETEFYKENDGKYSVPVMRALFFKKYMEEKTLYLGDDELIVGEKGARPQACPTFPEICTHTVEDMEIMNARDLVSFSVTPEDIGNPER